MTKEEDPIAELLPFLAVSARPDVKTVALQHVLGLTGSEDGVKTLSKHLLPLTDKLLALAAADDGAAGGASKDAALALINLTADASAARALAATGSKVAGALWRMVEDRGCAAADPACMALSNLTIARENCDAVAAGLAEAGAAPDRVVRVFCQEGYNEKEAKLHYLGPLLSNLSQLAHVRDALCDPAAPSVQRLLPFTEYGKSRVRRGGAVGALRNLCFDERRHAWLLSPSVDVLPRLLLPLAGPTPDDADPDEVDKLPVDLQYLGEDKAVEEDPDLRRMLLEALTQLCATREGREAVRNSGAYSILKQLHSNEEDAQARLACENLVDILIKKEEEIGLDNYKKVDVPDDVVEQLEDMDKEYLSKQ